MSRSFFQILNRKEKNIFFIFALLLSFCSILEMIGIGLIPLFVGSLFSSETIDNFLFHKISSFKDQDRDSMIMYFSTAIISVFAFKNLFLLTIYYFQGKYLTKLSQDIKQRFFSFYLNKKYIFHLNNSSNMIARNVLIETQAIRIFFYSLLQIIKESVILIGITLLLLNTNFVISTIVFIVLSTCVLLYYFFFKKNLEFKSKEQQIIRFELLKNINEIFGSIKDVLIFSKQKLVFQLFKKKDDKYENNIFYQDIVIKLPKLILELAAITLIIGALFYLEKTEINKEEIFVLLTLVSVSVIRIIPGYNIISGSLSRLKFIAHSISLMSKVLLNNKATNIETSKKQKKIFFKRFIQFKNVSFKYPGTKKNIFNNLNLKILSGSKILVKGSSGSGKSTFLNIVAGLIEVTEGKVLVDNFEIRKNLKNWYKNVSYVSQDIFLLDNTIKNNVTLNLDNSEMDKKKLIIAKKYSYLDTFIDSSGKGENTTVGERSARISGGQKQRIGIARAIYRNTNLIILDEATNALDKKLESKILKYFLQLNRKKTVIVSSHHNLSKKNFDFILNFKNGNCSFTKIRK